MTTLYLAMPAATGEAMLASAAGLRFRMIPRPMAAPSDPTTLDPAGRYVIEESRRVAVLEDLPDRRAQLARLAALLGDTPENTKAAILVWPAEEATPYEPA